MVHRWGSEGLRNDGMLELNGAQLSCVYGTNWLHLEKPILMMIAACSLMVTRPT